MTPLTVALDVAPLHGHRTGVAAAAGRLLIELDARADVAVVPYLVSYRAEPVPPQRRLPLPAGLASRVWALADHPRVDRWLGGADVLHGTNYVAPPSRLPTIISVYDCWFLAHPAEAAPAVRRAAAVLHRAVRRGAWIHVSSEATAAAAAELLQTDRIAVVLLGPPDTPTDPTDVSSDVATTVTSPVLGLRGTAPFVLSLGTVERRKDVPALVAAFVRLADTLPDLRLVVAGRAGDDSDRLDTTIAAAPMSVRDRIHVLGAVDEPTKHHLLRSATLLAYPSRDEGFGFPVLEAQRAGTPVVARRVGSIPEVGGDGVELVDPDDVDALTHGIERVATDQGRRAELVEHGRRNLTRFSWERTADGIVALYRRALGEGA